MKIKLFLLGFIYLGINELFVLKYASRFVNSSPVLYMALYALILGLVAVLFFKARLPERLHKVAYLSLVVIFFMGTLYLNVTVDGNSLQVDRWSAMHSAIEGLFQGRYPYGEIDHLGGRTSNLPGLIGIGIPFYLMGNIGYLQSFCFLVFAWLIFRTFKTYRLRLFCLLLLILSPSYLWEIYVKSDLMSNFIILLFFVYWIHRKYLKPKKDFGPMVPVLASALLLTRLVAVIPLSLVLAKRVFQAPVKKQVRFFTIALLTLGLLLWACFYHVESYENFISLNPFNLQNRQLPLLLSVLLSCTAVMFSFYISDFQTLLLACVAGVLLPALIAFTWRIFDLGFSTSLFGSGFDLSYFNIAMPFIVLSMGCSVKKSLLIIKPTRS